MARTVRKSGMKEVPLSEVKDDLSRYLKEAKMTKRKSYEEKILEAYEKGEMKSVSPTKTDLRKYKEAARATFIKDRRVNVRLSSPDLMDIQARAAEEGVPYQTLISSVLHKFVTG